MIRLFLNVQLGNIKTRINVDGIEDLSQVQDEIKSKYGEDIAVPPARIQLYDEQNDLVMDFDEIPEDYF